jgi:hypothetical protein
MEKGLTTVDMETIVKDVEARINFPIRPSSTRAEPIIQAKRMFGLRAFEFKIPESQRDLINQLRQFPKIEVVCDTFGDPIIQLSEVQNLRQQAWHIDLYPGVRFDSSMPVFVVDSGVNASHQEFASSQIRVIRRDGKVESSTEEHIDCLGHGTSVASMIGGRTVGVAPGHTIYSVPMTPGSNNLYPISELFLALESIKTYINTNPTKTECKGIVSLSMNAPCADGKQVVFRSVLEALQGLHEGSGLVVGSAGNDKGAMAASLFPCVHPAVLVVGSVNNFLHLVTALMSSLQGR